MNGVTILAEEFINDTMGTVQFTLAIIAFVFVLSLIIFFILTAALDREWLTALLIIATITVITVVSWVVTLCIPSLYNHKTQYYVTISDEVNFKEFTEKYEIVETKGDIYIVEEKSNDLQEND